MYIFILILLLILIIFMNFDTYLYQDKNIPRQIKTTQTPKPKPKIAQTKKPVVQKNVTTKKPVVKKNATTKKPIHKNATTKKPILKNATTKKPILKIPLTPKPLNSVERMKQKNYITNFQNLLKKPGENKQEISYNIVNYLNYNTVNSLLKTVPYPFETATPNEIIDNINFQYKLQSFL